MDSTASTIRKITGSRSHCLPSPPHTPPTTLCRRLRRSGTVGGTGPLASEEADSSAGAASFMDPW